MDDSQYVWVKRQPKDWREAKYNINDITGIHWNNISGGVGKKTIYGLYGYVNCQGALEGQVAHSGIHGPCPHDIKVFIPKNANKTVYAQLKAQTGEPKPSSMNKKYLVKDKQKVIYLMWAAKTPGKNYQNTSNTPDSIYESSVNASFIKKCKRRNLNWALISPTQGILYPNIMICHSAKRLYELTEEEKQHLIQDFDKKLANYEKVFIFTSRIYDRTALHDQILANSTLCNNIEKITKLKYVGYNIRR